MLLEKQFHRLTFRCFGFPIEINWAHGQVFHKEYPATWPWWRLVVLNHVHLNGDVSLGHRFWFYTRWGSPFIDFFKRGRR